jgi:uncharacterized membrane protein YedE/YeeE
MRSKVVALLFGTAFGCVLAWARLTDPAVIRRMLLLQEFDVFFLMGAAISVAAIGVRTLRTFRAKSLVTRELITWTTPRPRARHVVGSVIFGIGWSITGTCPGPMAAMIGQGRLGGLFVAVGVLAGIALQGWRLRRPTTASTQLERSSAPCL